MKGDVIRDLYTWDLIQKNIKKQGQKAKEMLAILREETKQ